MKQIVVAEKDYDDVELLADAHLLKEVKNTLPNLDDIVEVWFVGPSYYCRVSLTEKAKRRLRREIHQFD